MSKTSENWKHYFANVNDKLASIALNLALHDQAPIKSKSELLSVWVYFRSPRPDGLSDRSEFETLSGIEEELTNRLGAACQAIEAGRITSDGHREFYFYGANDKGFRSAVAEAMSRFREYKFDLGSQNDPDWNQYLHVLYPSDEDMEKIKNMDVLEVLRNHGDTLTPVRDVHHWIYFRSKDDRGWFASRVREMGYKVQHESEESGDAHPFGLQITRDQSVTPDRIDDAVLELFHLAKQVGAEYDGWEARVVAAQH